MTAPTPTEPILIVGCGPVGATLALQLAQFGVPSLVVDRAVAATPYPKMDFVNARSMELLHRLGVGPAIRERGVPPRFDFTFHWYTSLAEPPLAVWNYPSVDQQRDTIRRVNDGTMPAEPYQRLTGSILEEILRDAVRDHPLIELREGWTFRSLAQDDNVVIARLTDPDGQQHELRAAYAIGCDGAGSAVRNAADIGVDLIGPTSQHCDVYFRSDDPLLRAHGRYFLGIHTGGVMLVSRDEEAVWTATFPYEGEPPTDPLAVVQQRLGAPIRFDEVMAVAHWEGRLGVATTYRSGRVILAGDAAHQFYPTGGHGANTGLADAVDLAWKLAGVVQGWGGAGLLTAYETERRPVALINRELSFNLLEVWRRFPALAAVGATRAQLAGFLDQDAYQIDNLGIHFGARYTSPIVVPDGGPEPAWDWRRVTPEVWPGMRVPGLFLGDGEHLFDRLGAGFAVLDQTPDAAGAALVAAAQRRGVPIRHVTVDDDGCRKVIGAPLTLIRPDQHVAWHGDPGEVTEEALLDIVCGIVT
ncbi:2-polyprenyl-6-methoxyphenol hydroxylase-like FAD-dependent oxidoreductase [Allocatelliglobosispora scoriae]|uniref:2-polyprenyl-6-methoxyphenol hydroxylase-like FAD-dependent oxidoreductase n=1 Tax=Allocatelliglobosispora scoriae TaxID=643052 RepID=A0A841C2V3_9ACTN|nr:FAD-dependent monooxygenase [Allocatelliglobosispora scoriae]MBB5873639.1 2-polyprenyl-6-methoxyphenol hydroxylase-like FAD-dependent oxidoreductase [Allocatelliglobosispora scoriae]